MPMHIEYGSSAHLQANDLHGLASVLLFQIRYIYSKRLHLIRSLASDLLIEFLARHSTGCYVLSLILIRITFDNFRVFQIILA